MPLVTACPRPLAGASPATLLVSVADKVHNLGCIVRDYREHGEVVWGRFNEERSGIVWYYGRLLTIYERLDDPRLERLVGELRRSYTELESPIDSQRRGR